ncbi:MAG: bifunctional diaminohydroxyphosphoribosylaminopyrimidine deaminase/5-amino-6-(5-phosphoribosylamino)uracil reductase RibD [Oscillospiraceae bacterium]|nr:bifunctional diaminohydroxyphosphoribosylaminopyrimidine deaminase/5-amino-6-(5-phosphoribosylamino)uracil reductase RibD [Oscillospiraceae bacterium]
MDEQWMRRAITLAARGSGWTSPNPLVGAVIVKDGRVLAEGYHHRCGALHAEREAIAALQESAVGATIYVTLEPCCHTGRQPPCTDAILATGITRVVIGSRDPNPLVAGKGAAMLRSHGVTVAEDFLRAECDALNPVFFHYITTKTPYVVMKYAMTADGKIATRTGASAWVTGEAARGHVQTLRGRYRGIMVGIGTVLADDPLLTCRLALCRTPTRIVCDSDLRIAMDCRLVQTARDVPTIVACARETEKAAQLRAAGVTVLCLPGKDGRVDLNALMAALGQMEIDSILLEGGAALSAAALAAGIVKKVCCYIAPKIFGGAAAPSPVAGLGAETPAKAMLLSQPKITPIGSDVLLEYEVE